MCFTFSVSLSHSWEGEWAHGCVVHSHCLGLNYNIFLLNSLVPCMLKCNLSIWEFWQCMCVIMLIHLCICLAGAHLLTQSELNSGIIVSKCQLWNLEFWSRHMFQSCTFCFYHISVSYHTFIFLYFLDSYLLVLK